MISGRCKECLASRVLMMTACLSAVLLIPVVLQEERGTVVAIAAEAESETEKESKFSDRSIATVLEEIFVAAGGNIEIDPILGTWKLHLMKKNDEKETAVTSDGNMLIFDDLHYTLILNSACVSEGIYSEYEEREDSYILIDTDAASEGKEDSYYFGGYKRNSDGEILGFGLMYKEYILFFKKGTEWESLLNMEMEEGAAPGASMEQTEAVEKAKKLLEKKPYSASGIIKALKGEGLSDDIAQYAAKYCGADWKEEASRKAAADLKQAEFTRESMIERLIKAGFTEEEALFAADENGL